MTLQRLLELCEILKQCEQLPAGAFKVWARANAIRQIRQLMRS